MKIAIVHPYFCAYIGYYHLINSVIKLYSNLNIKTQIIISSILDIDREDKLQDRIFKICNCLNTNTYINAIGRKELYDKEVFKREAINLKLIKSKKNRICSI